MSPAILRHRNRQNAGLSDLLPYKSSATQQDVRFTTLAGRYATHGTISTASWSPSSPSHKSFSGIMALQSPTMQFSSRNAYTQREFPAETYVQVKRHVVSCFFLYPSLPFFDVGEQNYMREHPYEKTLRYKVSFDLLFCVFCTLSCEFVFLLTLYCALC